MTARSIALDHINGAEAAALLVDGRLDDLLIDGPNPVPAPSTAPSPTGR